MEKDEISDLVKKIGEAHQPIFLDQMESLYEKIAHEVAEICKNEHMVFNVVNNIMLSWIRVYVTFVWTNLDDYESIDENINDYFTKCQEKILEIRSQAKKEG